MAHLLWILVKSLALEGIVSPSNTTWGAKSSRSGSKHPRQVGKGGRFSRRATGEPPTHSPGWDPPTPTPPQPHLVLTQHGKQTGPLFCPSLLLHHCLIQRPREEPGHHQPKIGCKHVDVHHAYVGVHLQQSQQGSERRQPSHMCQLPVPWRPFGASLKLRKCVLESLHWCLELPLPSSSLFRGDLGAATYLFQRSCWLALSVAIHRFWLRSI